MDKPSSLPVKRCDDYNDGSTVCIASNGTCPIRRRKKNSDPAINIFLQSPVVVSPESARDKGTGSIPIKPAVNPFRCSYYTITGKAIPFGRRRVLFISFRKVLNSVKTSSWF